MGYETLLQDSGMLEAFRRMNSAELDAVEALIEAMLVMRGIRDAAIAFLDTCGLPDSVLLADNILNDAEGSA